MKRLITKEPITLRVPNKDLSQKGSNRVLRITRWVVLVILLPEVHEFRQFRRCAGKATDCVAIYRPAP